MTEFKVPLWWKSSCCLCLCSVFKML